MHWFRGQDVGELARSARFEQVATLLWKQDGADPFAQPSLEIPLPTSMAPLPRAISLLSIANQQDLKGLKLKECGVAENGARIIRLLTASFCEMPVTTAPVHEHFAEAWGLNEAAADLTRTALILAADHDQNASAFTVRCIASTHATPYGAINPGLCALQGPRHGGQTAQAIAHIDDIPAAPSASDAVMARLKRGERLPGFGIPFYPDLDPRAAAILLSVEENFGWIPTLDLADDIIQAARDAVALGPNIDFALATICGALSLPEAEPFAVFATGRNAGWLANAQEQYASPELIRPRTCYVGDEP